MVILKKFLVDKEVEAEMVEHVVKRHRMMILEQIIVVVVSFTC